MDMAMNKMTMLVMFLSLAFVGKTEARGTGTFTCSIPGLTNQQMTIPMSLVCDGVITCGLGEDEKDCPAISATTTTPPTTTTTPKPDMSIVLITGGDSGNQMEIINHDNSTTKCQNDYTYPISVYWASGAVVDGNIVVCGGSYPTTKQCYSFGHDKKWKAINPMTTPRRYAASIPINNALWVGGGLVDVDNRYKSTELVYLDGRRSSTKQQLPEARSASCAAEYNGNIFLTGGKHGYGYGNIYSQDNTWIINTNDDFRLTNGPNMLKTRAGHACGIFHSHAHSGRAVIVTAGGFGDETSTGKPIVAAGSGSYGTGPNNCEFWDFTVQGSTWQLCSQDLPTRMFGSRMTPTADGKGLLLSYLNSVYSFVCQSETSCMFAPTEIQLQIERKNHLMLQVPSSLLSEC